MFGKDHADHVMVADHFLSHRWVNVRVHIVRRPHSIDHLCSVPSKPICARSMNFCGACFVKRIGLPAIVLSRMTYYSDHIPSGWNEKSPNGAPGSPFSDGGFSEPIGKPNVKSNSARAQQHADELVSWLKWWTEELEQERQISAAPLVIVGGCAVHALRSSLL